MAVLGLSCYTFAFSSCCVAVASLVVEHRLSCGRGSSVWLGSVVVAHRLSCPVVHGIFLDTVGERESGTN